MYTRERCTPDSCTYTWHKYGYTDTRQLYYADSEITRATYMHAQRATVIHKTSAGTRKRRPGSTSVQDFEKPSKTHLLLGVRYAYRTKHNHSLATRGEIWRLVYTRVRSKRAKPETKRGYFVRRIANVCRWDVRLERQRIARVSFVNAFVNTLSDVCASEYVEMYVETSSKYACTACKTFIWYLVVLKRFWGSGRGTQNDILRQHENRYETKTSNFFF